MHCKKRLTVPDECNQIMNQQALHVGKPTETLGLPGKPTKTFLILIEWSVESRRVLPWYPRSLSSVTPLYKIRIAFFKIVRNNNWLPLSCTIKCCERCSCRDWCNPVNPEVTQPSVRFQIHTVWLPWKINKFSKL